VACTGNGERGHERNPRAVKPRQQQYSRRTSIVTGGVNSSRPPLVRYTDSGGLACSRAYAASSRECPTLR
jgi:hypothetical protein